MGGFRGTFTGAVAALSLVLVSSAFAQSQPIADPTKPAPPPPEKPADKPSNPTPSPFSFTAAYTFDILDVVSGGRSTGPGKADLLKLSGSYDGSIHGHEGLTGLISVEHTFGSSFTARKVGGFQSVTSAEAQPADTRLYEAWVQQELLGGSAGGKAGLIDLNTTFDVQQTAALFLSASHGIGPDISDTGLNGPSIYPTTALAVTAYWRPNEEWTAQLGVFDGVAGDPAHRSNFVSVRLDGVLLIGQIERRFGDRLRIEGGAYLYSNRFPSLDQFNPDGTPKSVRGNIGVYGLVEGKLLSKGEEGGLSGWVRVGLANGDINPARNYLGAGLVYTGLLPGRGKDEAGIALARVGFGAGARAQALANGVDVRGAESVVEATYRYGLNDTLTLQPDVQYVIRPHGDAGVSDALVIGLRLAFTLAK